MTERILLANRIVTPDGTTLQSYHRHDYKEYVDANGKEYMVDGGLYYLRRNVHDDAPYVEDSVYADDPHYVIRDALHWGTYGKKGDQPRQWKPVCALSDEHIRAIIETQHHIPRYLRKVFEDELDYRLANHIEVEDKE